MPRLTKREVAIGFLYSAIAKAKRYVSGSDIKVRGKKAKISDWILTQREDVTFCAAIEHMYGITLPYKFWQDNPDITIEGLARYLVYHS